MHPYFIPLQQASYDTMQQKNKIYILCHSGVCNLFISHINTPIWGTLTSKDTVSNLCSRRLTGSTHQADPSCLYFRISYYWWNDVVFTFFHPPPLCAGPQKPRTLTVSKIEYENFWPKTLIPPATPRSLGVQPGLNWVIKPDKAKDSILSYGYLP